MGKFFRSEIFIFIIYLLLHLCSLISDELSAFRIDPPSQLLSHMFPFCHSLHPELLSQFDLPD